MSETPSPRPIRTAAAMDAALKAMARAIGADQVFAAEEDRLSYSDPLAADAEAHQPRGAVAPRNVEEIRAVLRVANEHKVPLWSVSRGKNLGYGGAAPALKGSIVLDLSRMKKIEFDPDNGVVLVEPGVSFYDLYDHIQAAGGKYWLSVPGNSWGSVAGNALERGSGPSPFGDHAERICGLEVMLANGELVRTGMGAMANSPNWQLYKPGFGPSWDAAFCQSNFGVVTKLGLWLMPAPETVVSLNLQLDKEEDLAWAVDTLAPLRRSGVLRQSSGIGNWMLVAAVPSTREQWTDKPGRLDEGSIAALRKHYDIGFWNMGLMFHGPSEITEAGLKVAERAFNGHPLHAKSVMRWKQGDAPPTASWAGVPTTTPLANANWHGGRGGHMGFSPIMPPSGRVAAEQYRALKARYDQFDLDCQTMFAVNERSMMNINQVFYDKDDPAMVGRVHGLLKALFDDASAKGYGEYRTHIEEMDRIAGSYDFNDHALRRLNERVKDALDPNGILSPGKSGIWPAAYRAGRS